MTIQILSFGEDEALLDRFIEFPSAIYGGSVLFAPPSRDIQQAQLSPSAYFLKHGRLRCFLAIDENDRPCGRIAAMVNYNLKHPVYHIGHVGFFEVIDRYEVASQLLDHAIEYLKQERCTTVWGPLNFSTLHNYRFLTKGFDLPAFYGDVYNPPYYPEFFERYGFGVLRNYTTAETNRPAEIQRRYEPSRKALAEKGYRIRNIDVNHFNREMLLLYNLIIDIFADNFAFSYLGPDEFLDLYSHYQGKLAPDHLRFVHDPEGAPVAFLLCIPDYAGRISNTMITKTLGVSRSSRGLGISEALYHDAILYYGDKWCNKLISPQRILGNPSERFGGEETFSIIKEYKLYAYDIP